MDFQIAWANTATYVDSDITTNPEYALTEHNKQVASATAGDYYYDVIFTGNSFFINNTDATTARLVVSNGSGTTTISEDTTLTEDTFYGDSLTITDTYSLTIADGASLYILGEVPLYDSGVVSITDQKLFTFDAQTDASARLLLTDVSYLGLVFGGTLATYGLPEYPLVDEQQDFGFKKRTINGTTLYTENFISNDISLNLFSTFDEYKALRTAQRAYRNNLLCVINSDDEYYIRYGFLDLVNGAEERGRYYVSKIKLEGV
jgi:hypothetical protein